MFTCPSQGLLALQEETKTIYPRILGASVCLPRPFTAEEAVILTLGLRSVRKPVKNWLCDVPHTGNERKKILL